MSLIRVRALGVSVITAAGMLAAVPSMAQAGFGPPGGPTSPPFWQCPAVGKSTSCSFLIELTGSSSAPVAHVYADPSQEFYDSGHDDEIVAVQNDTDGPIAKLHIGVPGSGDNLFGFEGDGLCNPGIGATPSGCPFGGSSNTSDPFDYYGPDMAFEPGYSSDDGTVDFTPALQPGQYTFFALDAPFDSSQVEVPVGTNDLITTVLTDASSSSNTGAQVSRTSPGDFTDQATLKGANASSGNGKFTYTVYSDSTCTKQVGSGGTKPIGTPSDPVGGSLPNNARYYWQVTYTPGSGDPNNAVTSTCGVETMTFGTPPSPPSTGVSTTLSDGKHSGATLSVGTGTGVTDSATITGTNAGTATGTVTYSVYSDSVCAQQVAGAFPVHGDIRNVSGGSAPASAALTLPVGTYYLRAVYSGDSSHASAASPCGTEVLNVRTPTTLSTVISARGKAIGPSATVSPGTPVSDTAAVLSGGKPAAGATGAVFYALYSAAKDPSCAKAPVARSTGTVLASGAATPFRLPHLKPGRYLIVAGYTGDSTYLTSLSGCGSEVITVRRAAVTVSKPKVTASGTIVNRVKSNTGGRITVVGTVANPTALSARAKPCGRGQVRVGRRCAALFGTAQLKVSKAGTYVIKLVPGAAALRALRAGATLTVIETLTLRPRDRSKPGVKVVRVKVRLKKHH